MENALSQGKAILQLGDVIGFEDENPLKAVLNFPANPDMILRHVNSSFNANIITAYLYSSANFCPDIAKLQITMKDRHRKHMAPEPNKKPVGLA